MGDTTPQCMVCGKKTKEPEYTLQFKPCRIVSRCADCFFEYRTNIQIPKGIGR